MSQELNVDLGQSGLSVTANVYLLGALNVTGIACAEIGVTGKYSGDFSAAPNVAGVYQVSFFANGSAASVGGGQIAWNGTAEVLQSGDSFALLGAPAGASVSADVAAIKGVLPAALVGGRIDASVGAIMYAPTFAPPAQPTGAIMRPVHDPLSFYCGDTWRFAENCQDGNGAALDLTGATVQWLLDDVTGATNFLTLAVGSGITVIDMTGGVVGISASSAQTAGLAPGAYRDTLRVTLPGGLVLTQWVGAITALAAPR